jgi:hypothetical protein
MDPGGGDGAWRNLATAPSRIQRNPDGRPDAVDSSHLAMELAAWYASVMGARFPLMASTAPLNWDVTQFLTEL